MTEHANHDDVMDSLRRARPEHLPEELASPHAPAAQALLQEILSMDTLHPSETTDLTDDDVELVPVALTDHRPPHRRRRFAIGGLAATAAAITAIVVATSVFGPAEPSAADTVKAALTHSAAALEDSGRAEVISHWRFAGRAPGEWYPLAPGDAFDDWEFSGDDWSVTFGDYIDGQRVSPYGPGLDFPINRWVDGELYLFIRDSRNPDIRWFHNTKENPSDNPLKFDPATLLAELHPDTGFEEVGREDIDGVSTRHLQATNPGDMPLPDLGNGIADKLGVLTKLELWIDDDNLIRRIDIAYFDEDGLEFTNTGEVTDTKTDFSIRFFDFGVPITIEAPSDWEDIAPEG
jgi:hypothetical protein